MFIQEQERYSKLQQLYKYQTTKSHYKSLGDWRGDEDEKECIYFCEPIQIHAEAIYNKNHSPFKEIVGVVQREGKRLT